MSHPTKTLRVGMLGCGVVGQGVLRLLAKHTPDLRANGLELQVTHIALRDVAKSREHTGNARITNEPMAVANDPDIDILVEVMGGNTIAVEAGCAALSRGIPLVTANKSALARSLPRYLEASAAGKAGIAFESAVAAHIPIIEALDRSLALEEISVIKGVINGTTNYILTFMERAGCEYAEALADAASKGYTEADPSLDVDGWDAAEKLSLLALKAFGVYVPPTQFPVTGISGITQADIALANELGHRIKLVASARRHGDNLAISVQPALAYRGELLGDVDSEFNAVILEGPSFRELSFLGKGAGQLPTASAVLNDLLKVARDPQFSALPGLKRAGSELLHAGGPAADSCWFLRIQVPPVESWRVLEKAGKLRLNALNRAQVVVGGVNYLGVITDIMPESRILSLLPELQKISGVQAPPALLRLDKDNYRDIVEREQSAYFGTSLERKPGAGV